jgi:hypothetical protein
MANHYSPLCLVENLLELTIARSCRPIMDAMGWMALRQTRNAIDFSLRVIITQ